jgi:hypothetical protein
MHFVFAWLPKDSEDVFTTLMFRLYVRVIGVRKFLAESPAKTSSLRGVHRPFIFPAISFP